jgi:DNA-binding NarL/FixJ family response regulator
LKPRPERGVGQGTVLYALLQGFAERPWFDALFVSGPSVMASHQSIPPPSKVRSLPMNQATWQTIAEELQLSPQQTRIVELILCGYQDKDIAAELSLSVPTIRTYLKRTFDRVEVADRMGLVLHVFSIAQKHATSSESHR